MRDCLSGAALVVCVAMVAGGCENTRAPAAGDAYEPEAPRAALVKWHQSLAFGDKPRYLSCFVGSEDELVLALAVFDAVHAAHAFHDAVVRAYGPEAWQAFEASPQARVVLFPREDTWPARVTVVRTGAIAFGYLPHARLPLHLAEGGGAWRIHAGSLVPPGQTAEQAAYYLFRWAAALQEMTLRVGQPGVAASEVAPEAAREAFKAKVGEEQFDDADKAVQHMMMH